ncbi:hypothetical protein ACFQ14_06085 [Pseudahrensia aquimaris]|uniref:FG-GAP repeat protein n=1 Tax=Pseudahrensia aquimaris TaxID=744461 RepID=A0ABW3FGM1_9HYPH
MAKRATLSAGFAFFLSLTAFAQAQTTIPTPRPDTAETSEPIEVVPEGPVVDQSTELPRRTDTEVNGWKLTQVGARGQVLSSAAMPIIIQCRDGSFVDPAFQVCFGAGAAANLPRPFVEVRPTARPDGGMRDGRIARSVDAGDISEAWYIKPTQRYAHAILGDDVEAGGLAVRTADSKVFQIDLPEEEVFEDITPRIIDLDGLGKNHVVTLRSHKDKGASIAVYGLVDEELILLAQTSYIGRTNRWRNVAGIEDFDGDGSLQIAEVVTPHIGGTLNFWTWKNGALVFSGSAFGFSNHEIGSREQRLSTVNDFDGDGVSDIALPSGDRKSLRLMRFDGTARGEKMLQEIASIPLPARIDKAIGSHFNGRGTTITVGLEDGSVYVIHQ